jgi:hypothetical protein
VSGTIDTSGGREFWEAWVDSKSETPPAPKPEAQPSSEAPPSSEAQPPEAPRRERRERRPERPALEAGQIRLYLNLGRRDGVDDEKLAAFLAEKGVSPLRSELHSSHTYLIVDEAGEAPAVGALHGHKYGERDVICERARK